MNNLSLSYLIIVALFSLGLAGCGGSTKSASLPAVSADTSGGSLAAEDLPPPGLSIRNSFNGGFAFQGGSLQLIEWSINTENSPLDPGFYLSEVQYSINGTSGWTTVPGCDKVPGMSRTSTTGSDIGCYWRMTNDGTPSGTNLVEGPNYKIRIKITNSNGKTSNCDTAIDSDTEDYCDTSDSSLIVDQTSPVITGASLKVAGDNGTAALASGAASVKVELNYTDNLSIIQFMCIKTDRFEPTSDHSCFKRVTPVGGSISAYQGLGFIPGTIPLYVWIKDAAGNISILGSAGVGTPGTDQRDITYSPSQTIEFLNLTASTVDQSTTPDNTQSLISTAGQTVYIRWKFSTKTSASLNGATPVTISYSINDGDYVKISNYAERASSGCTAESSSGVTYAGCVPWSADASVIGKKLRFKIEITDLSNTAYAGVTNFMNTGNFRVLTGYTYNGVGDHASNTAFSIVGGAGIGATAPNTLTVTDEGNFFINDTANGVIFINKDDGKSRLLIPKTTYSCDTNGIINSDLTIKSGTSFIDPSISISIPTNHNCQTTGSSSIPTVTTVLGLALDFETPQNLYILEPYRVRKLSPITIKKTVNGVETTATHYKLVTVMANDYNNDRASGIIDRTISPNVVTLGIWKSSSFMTDSGNQLFMVVPNGDLYISMSSFNAYAGVYQIFVYRPTMTSATNMSNYRLSIPANATGAYSCNAADPATCGKSGFNAFKPLITTECTAWRNWYDLTDAQKAVTPQPANPNNCLRIYGRPTVTFNSTTRKADGLHIRWDESGSNGLFHSTSHNPRTGTSLLTATGGFTFKFHHKNSNHHLLTSRKGELYLASLNSAKPGIYKYNMSAPDSEDPWVKILGNGSIGNCPDQTPATQCAVDLSDVFVTNTDQVFFISRSQVRTIDERGVVVTLFGKSKAHGDGGVPLMARYSTIPYIGAWFDGAKDRVVTMDSDEFAIRESYGNTVMTIAGTPARTSNLNTLGPGSFSTVAPQPSDKLATEHSINTTYWGGQSGMIVSHTNGNVFFSTMNGGLYKLDRSSNIDQTKLKLNLMLGTAGGTSFLGDDSCFAASDGKSCRVVYGYNSQPHLIAEIPAGTGASPAKILFASWNTSTKDKCYNSLMNQDNGKVSKYYGGAPCYDSGVYYDLPSTQIDTGAATSALLYSPYESNKIGNGVYVPVNTTTSYLFTFTYGRAMIARITNNMTADSSPTTALQYKPFVLPTDDKIASMQIATNGTTQYMVYCTTSGLLKYATLDSTYNLVSSNNIAVVGALNLPSNIKCAGRSMDVTNGGKRIVFPFTENGLWGVAEYQVFP